MIRNYSRISRIFSFSYLFTTLILVLSAELSATSPGNLPAASLPVLRTGFMENRGQFTDMEGNAIPHVFFKYASPGVDLYITDKGLTHVLFQEIEDENLKSLHVKTRKQYKWNTVDINLRGARILKENILAEDALDGHFNFFLPGHPDGLYDVKSYGRIVVKNVYPGIDWVLYSAGKRGFKYDFVVHPGADASLIRLEYRSLVPAKLNDAGNIEVVVENGSLRESSPYTYIKENGVAVESAFQLLTEKRKGKVYTNTFGFLVPDAKKFLASTMIIDPQLTWSTFIGGNDHERNRAIEIDQNGNIYTVGTTQSFNMPLFNAGTYFQATGGGIPKQYIMKFSSANTLLWATVYAGFGVGANSDGSGLTIDKFGNVFMCGTTTCSNFPVQNNNTYYQPVRSGLNDATIVKFDNLGNRLWATHFGGSSVEEAFGICADTSGNVFLVGTTQSTNMPVMNANTYYQASGNFVTSGYVSKFDNAGNLIWSTYYDGLLPIAATVSENNELLITGGANQGALVLQNPGGGAYTQTNSVLSEAAIVKFSNNGSLIWSTYLGGTGIDQGRSITSDKSGNFYVAGITTSTNFPLQNAGGYFQNTIGSLGLSTGDAFISKFAPNGAMLWSTFFGGNNVEFFYSHDNLCTDTCGTLYLAFSTKSSNMPTKPSCEGGFIDSVFDFVSNASADIFIARFDTSTNCGWATYAGGSGVDAFSAVDVHPNGSLYVTGQCTPTYNQKDNYIIVQNESGYIDSTGNGASDIYMMQFSPLSGSHEFSYGNTLTCKDVDSLTFSTASLPPGGVFNAAPGLILNPGTGVVYPSGSTPGTYTVSYTFSIGGCACYMNSSGTQSIGTTITITALPVLSVSPPDTICLGGSSTHSVSGASSYIWSTGSFTNTMTVSPASSGVFSVTGTSSLGCSAGATVSVLVLPLPLLSLTGSQTLCVGDSVLLKVSGAATFQWSSGSSGSSILVSPSTSTFYSVTGTDQWGCSSTASINLSPFPVPALLIHGDIDVCNGSAVTKTVSGATNYTWSTGQNTSVIVLSPSVSGVYSVTGTNQKGCIAQASTSVTVHPVPTLTLSGDTIMCIGENATHTVSGAGSYSWSTGAITNTLSLQPPATAVYSVTGINAAGCSATANFTLYVDECLSLGENLWRENVRVYPNPNNGMVTVELNNNQTLLLFNEMGQKIKHLEFKRNIGRKVTLNDLPSGVYFLRAIGAGVEESYKIVVE